MDTENPSAPSCAQPRVAAEKHPNRGSGGGLIHEHTRHTSHFTVVGNDLAQHPDLSGLAVGVGVHIQSLPTGARVDIKTLAERLKEGRTRISAALRELEAVGRLPGPPPGRTASTAAPVPASSRTGPAAQTPVPELRRLRPPLPGRRSRPLPRLPNRSPGGRLA